ncbi:hypothetical protein, conserved [Eimeria brunetti]|uniref:Uncharacterized protein n=1 Tax=Eimeria brunetti TaxID=51314 RepID=U6LSK4_9EIME|nr:hypothetical protein, conserved [Eimeria brunetti]
MRAVLPQAAASCAVDDSTVPGTGERGGYATEAAAGAVGLNANCRAAACAARSSVIKLQRQHPAAFAAVAAAASSAGQLQLLQDPLWLAVMGTVHAWQHSTHVEAPSNAETANLSAAAEEGFSVAAAIREAARVAKEGDPLVRLEAAVLLGEAAALLHSIGDALAASSQEQSAVGHESTNLGSEHSQCLASAAESAANALELMHLRLLALPVSVSIVSLGSRGAAPWKPRPCTALSGVAATPLVQLPGASDELLLLDKQICLARRFLASLDACGLEKIQPLHLRCMQALQQVQQLALQLALPGGVATAGQATTTEATAETAAETPADAAKTAAADHGATVQYHYTCGGVALPPVISSSPGLHDKEVNWQHWLRSRGAVIAPAGPAVENSFLLKHAAKLHALLTSSLRPELALR